MPKHTTCPEHTELDIYNNCPYGCIYCITQTKEFSIEFNLSKEIEKIRMLNASSKPYYLSPWTDCYPPEEEKKKYTRQILFELAQNNIPFFVITKSPLVLRDIDYFKNRGNTFIAVSLNTLNNDTAKTFETKAPSATERKKLIEELLKEKSIKTVVKIDPVIPGITDGKELEELIDWLCKIKPFAVTIETLRLSLKIIESMRIHLSEKTISKIIRYYGSIEESPIHPDIDYRMNLFKESDAKFKKADIKASFCRATLPVSINKNDCRGGYNSVC